MKIINHFAAGVETIKVNQENKKVIVENQSYSIMGRHTKTYTKIYEFGSVPKDVWIKIKKEELRIAEEESS